MSCKECDLNYRLAVICGFVCLCSKAPEIGKSGAQLKQLCVDKGLSSLNAAGGLPGVLPEVGYAMTNPPEPLITDERIDEETGEITRKKTGKKTGKKIPVDNFGEMIGRTKHIFGKNHDEKLGQGKFRIPDVTLLNNPALPPTSNEGGNMQAIVEIKFKDDEWREGQKEAYEDIAGEQQFIIMGDPPDTSAEEFCQCEGTEKPQGKYALEKQPALEWDRQGRPDKMELPLAPQPDTDLLGMIGAALGLIATGAALLWLVGNDITGVGAADDPLIPPTTAAFAAFAAALGLSSTASAQETLHDSFPDDVYP